jgi:hypothetical protein
MYNLHRKHNNPAVFVGSAVIDTNGLCPAFNRNMNSNLLENYFGMEFIHNGHTYILAIPPFKFVLCFRLTDELRYQLSQHCNSFCMDAAIPAISLAWIFEQILEHCIHVHSHNFEIYKPNQFATPAACVQTFLNGAVGVWMPSCEVWVKEHTEDPELSALLQFVQNPGTISQRSLESAKLDPNYCQALHQTCIHLDNGNSLSSQAHSQI